MSTAIKNPRTLVAAGTTNTAAGTTRGTVDLRTALGGVLTMKITNGATGPTAGCEGRVLIAHNTAATPAAAAAGADWKTYWSYLANTAASGASEQSIPIPTGVMHLEVEFTGNLGQDVTVEAYFSEVTSIG